jgi:hypothetical protein
VTVYIIRQAYLSLPHLTTACSALRKMTNLVETELFGGAIKASLPQGFADASYVIGRNRNLVPFPTSLDLA